MSRERGTKLGMEGRSISHCVHYCVLKYSDGRSRGIAGVSDDRMVTI